MASSQPSRSRARRQSKPAAKSATRWTVTTPFEQAALRQQREQAEQAEVKSQLAVIDAPAAEPPAEVPAVVQVPTGAPALRPDGDGCHCWGMTKDDGYRFSR